MITDITISQDNIYNGSNLVPVHSPLVFLADVTYTSQAPDIIYVDILVDGEVVDTFKPIPFADPLGTVRTFAFVASEVLKGIMAGFDDFAQLIDTFNYVDGITKLVTIKFYDPDAPATSDSVEVDLIHGAAQFGENPNLDGVYNNEDQVYVGPEGSFVYIYFYNDDVANVLTIGSPVTLFEIATDFDDVEFTDFDDVEFEIEIDV